MRCPPATPLPHLFWRPGAGPAPLPHQRPKRAEEGRARTVRARRRPGPAAEHAQVGRDRRKLRQRGVKGRAHHRPPLRPAHKVHTRQCTQAQRAVCWLSASCHTARSAQSVGCDVCTSSHEAARCTRGRMGVRKQRFTCCRGGRLLVQRCLSRARPAAGHPLQRWALPCQRACKPWQSRQTLCTYQIFWWAQAAPAQHSAFTCATLRPGTRQPRHQSKLAGTRRGASSR